MDIKKIDPKERLIFALDVTSREEAEKYVKELDGLVGFFKIGIILHTILGTEFTSSLIKRGKKVFLDLKFLDVGATVREAVKQVANLGASFLTVHGNREIIEGAVQGKAGSDLKILSVTLLTNMDAADLKEMGLTISVKDFVLFRTRKALEAGCDGVITSGREASLIKKEAGDKLLIVTPGIRPSGTAIDDHKRSVTPAEAIGNGADYLVIGRPIRKAENPRTAAEEILKEMDAAFQARVK